MINTENGKKLGVIYLPIFYGEERIGMIVSYLTIILVSIEPKKYNYELTGICDLFDPLKDMETVPTYDLKVSWYPDYEGVMEVKVKRLPTYRK